ncbi:MAG: nucleotidyltransferase family protein [Sedimenticola sp.]
MSHSRDLLIHTLIDPQRMARLSLSDWDLLVRQGRSAGLLTYLCDAAERLNILEDLPERPRNHLVSARILTHKHQRDIRWEVHCIMKALRDHEHPVILLKGAAYLLSGLPISRVRIFSDVDILVPKEMIDDVEATLRLKGWMTSTRDEYDQRYYRTWMHELPPLRHSVRNVTLDVHHNILPTTARLHPDPEKLRDNAVPVEGFSRLQVLSPADMVLHSATHLFHDGELEHGIRDLVDLDSLLRHFGSLYPDFWQQLMDRAKVQDLQRPLYYALNYTRRMLRTPVPEEVMKKTRDGGPGILMSGIMDALFTRALRPDHSTCNDWFTGTARWMLYIRSHYLRMPFHLLIPHLLHKSFLSPYKTWKEDRKKRESVNNFDEFMQQAKSDNQ